jgi:hypothetical protein
MTPKKATPQNSPSQDLDLINLDEIDDDVVARKKLHEWSLRNSSGEVPSSFTTANTSLTFHRRTPINTIKEEDESEDAKPQDSTPEAKDGEKYQFPDWSKHIAESPEMSKKHQSPSRYKHTRGMLSTAVNPPVAARHHQRHNAYVPPVPPIPEKYRAEWELQESKRRAEAANASYPILNPGAKKDADSKYVRKPQPAYPNALDPAKKEAARRANEKRQKAFDAVVLEDEQDRAKGKENGRGGGGPAQYGYAAKPLPRSDVRLPRSPGMLNLAQQKPEEFNASPEADRSLSRLPEPMMKHDSGDGDDEGVEEPALLSRPVQEVNKAYVDSIDFESEVAHMEAEAEEREKRTSSK